MIELRIATQNDADTVADGYLASRKQFLPYAPIAHPDDEVRRWIRETLIPTGDVTVAVDNDVVVGMMALSVHDGLGWVDQLYLRPESVGLGIGTLLIAYAKTSLGPPIRLYTFQENRLARRFYERHGFQPIAFTDGAGNEERCPDVLYEWAP